MDLDKLRDELIMNEIKKREQKYERWFSPMIKKYSRLPWIVGSVFEAMMKEAERDGFSENLEEDEDRVCTILSKVIKGKE